MLRQVLTATSPGAPERRRKHFSQIRIRKRMRSVLTGKAVLEKPFAWAQVNNKFGLKLMHGMKED